MNELWMADEVIKFFDRKKGFDHWWHMIDEETKLEIRKELNELLYQQAENTAL